MTQQLRVSKAYAGVVVMAGFALLVSGCSPDADGDAAPPEPAPIVEPENGGAATATPPATAPPELEFGALDEYMAHIYGRQLEPLTRSILDRQLRRAEGYDGAVVWEPEADVARAQEREDLTATCMAEQGFTYYQAEIPTPPPGRPTRGSREWFAEFGLGISTDPDGWVNWGGPDPNHEQLEAMSDDERADWLAALFGPLQADGLRPTGGCDRWAHSVQFPDPDTPEQFAGIQWEVREFGDLVAVDPRIVALTGAWAACMADAGHAGFADNYAVWPQLTEEWADIVPQAELDEVYANWDWAAYPDGPSAADLPQPDPAAAAAFTDREITLALASYDCRYAVGWAQRYQEVALDLQQQFVDQHRDELEAWAQYMEAHWS